MRQAEQALTTHIAAGIPVSAAARIRVLLGEADTDPVDGGDGGVEVFAQIGTDPGNVSLDTCVEEVSKLEAVRAIGLPTTLFVDEELGGGPRVSVDLLAELLQIQVSYLGRCAGPPWRRENGAAFVRDAGFPVMP